MNSIDFNSVSKEILTERLKLKLISENDIKVIHELLSIPAVDRFNTLGIPVSRAETEEIIKPLIDANLSGEKYCYSVILKESNAFIGLFGITPSRPKYNAAEVWFKYNPIFWGNGFATEALQNILEICFNQFSLHRVEAGCAVQNVASSRVMEKAGMKREGQRRKTLPLKNGWSDNYEYAILAEDLVHD